MESKNEYPEDKNENKSFIKNHTNRWQICEEEVLNPNITAKELRQKIINGASPVAVHPYALRFRVCGHSTIVPEDWERIIVKQTKDGMYKIEEEVLDVIFKIINQSKLFIPVWIAPWADEKEIEEEVINILRPLRKKYKQEYKKLVKNNIIASCNIKTIKHDIKALELYDEIVEDFKINPRSKKELTIKDGYYFLPTLDRKCDIIKRTIYDELHYEEVETCEKTYWSAYNKAVLLIKNAPNIIFIPSSIRQLKKTGKRFRRWSSQIPIPSIDTNKSSILIE